ncbi:MAG: hypothetical protein ACK5JG_14450 [Pseudomonadota bacterium]|jgi:hypothetical protein
MLDLAGFLTSPRLFLGGLLGLLVGLGVAYTIRMLFPAVPIELLALIVAVAVMVGLLMGAWLRDGKQK